MHKRIQIIPLLSRFLLFLLLAGLSSFAQDSRSTSNYAGTNVLSLNPAEIADSRFKAYVNLAGVYADYQNNFSRWTAPHSYLRSALKPAQFPGDYTIQQKKNIHNAEIYGKISGPQILLSLPSLKVGLAAGVNSRLFVNYRSNSEETSTFLYKGLYYRPLHSTVHQNQSFQMDLGSYNEFFVSGAMVINERINSALKVGFTLKKLSSNLTFNLIGDDLAYRVEQSPLDPTKSDVFLNRSVGSFINASNNFIATPSWLAQQLTAINGIGNGFGTDIGLVYEFRPSSYKFKKKIDGKVITDPKVNKYKWKFGFSLQDIGYLKFNDPKVQIASVNAGNNEFINGDFRGVSSANDFINVLENEYNINPASYSTSFNVLMPASLIIHGDLKLEKDWYLAAVFRQTLISPNRIGPYRSSSLLLVPRLEKKWIELMFPFAISNDLKNINFGITGRAGPLFIGLTDVTLLSPQLDSRGIAGEVGLFIPIYHQIPKSPLKCFFEEKRKRPGKGLFNSTRK